MVPPRSSAKVRAGNCRQIKREHQLLSCFSSGALSTKLPFFIHSCVLDLVCGIKKVLCDRKNIHESIHHFIPFFISIALSIIIQRLLTIKTLTPSLPKHVKCMHASANSIFSGPVTHLLSMLWVLMKTISHASAKKKTKRVKRFKFGTFIDSFQVISWQ